MAVRMRTNLTICISVLVITSIISSQADEHDHDENKGDQPTAHHKLILILLDGFRWDYFSSELKGFQMMFQNGVKAEYMESCFPSLSYPNYYSIATGRYAESHGMVENKMYDPAHDKEFHLGTDPENYDTFWWDGADPIWMTATRQKRDSYMLFWPGSEVKLGGLNLAFCERYPGATVRGAMPTLQNFSWSMDTAFDAMRNNKADFVGIYVEMTDHIGHVNGPLSLELNQTIQAIDKELLYLQTRLETTNMADSEIKMADIVNIMIVSDHGMAPLRDVPPEVKLADAINMDDIERYIGYDITPTVQLWPKKDKIQDVYDAIKDMPGMTVYRKEDFPQKYHFAHHPRVPPLYLLADDGWLIRKPNSTGQSTYKGIHGYRLENPDMRAIFVARGPDFKVNYRKTWFQNIELYQVMCNILGIEPSPHNGTWENISDILSKTSTAEKKPHFSVLWPSLATIAFTLALVGAVVLCIKLNSTKTVRYRKMLDDNAL